MVCGFSLKNISRSPPRRSHFLLIFFTNAPHNHNLFITISLYTARHRNKGRRTGRAEIKSGGAGARKQLISIRKGDLFDVRIL